jgi:hypothetical protein
MMKKSIFFVLVFFSLSLQAKSFKCWTNSDGIRECGNSFPPQYVKQRVEYFNEKSGRVNNVTNAAKTSAQMLAEQKQAEEQNNKEREQRKQKYYDDVLLKTYLSIDDLLLSLHWKMTTLNSRINVTEGELDAANKKFLTYNRQAAQIERSGKKIYKNLAEDIQHNRKQINKFNQRIIQLEQDKTDIHAKFSHDIDRFVIARINGLTLTLKDDHKARPLDVIQFNCLDISKCDDLWQSAKGFIAEHSDLKIIFDTDFVYTTISPQKARQLAYSISKIDSQFDNTKSIKITLKIRCQPSREGEKLCKSQLVTDLLSDFKQRLMGVYKQ